MDKTVVNYKNHDYAMSSKRFLISLFDAFLLMLLSFALLLVGMNLILPNIPSYQGKVNAIEENRIAMLKMSEEAGLTTYHDNDNGLYENPDAIYTIYKKYVGQHILLSYEMEPSKWEITPKIDGLTKASYENDNFALFYVSYVNKYNTYNGHENDLVNLGGFTNKAYLQNLLKTKDTSLSAWVSDAYLGRSIDDEEFLFLKAGFAQSLYLRVYQDEKSTDANSSHIYFYTMFKNIWENATEELTNSTRFEETYQRYEDNYVFAAHIASLVTVLIYLVCFIILFIVPAFIFKNNHGTFGYKIFKLAVVKDDKEHPKTWQILIRNLILFVSNLPTLLIASFLSGGLSSSLVFPLFNKGPSLLQILIVCAIIPVVDMFMVSLSLRKKSIAEWASKTVIVDSRKSLVNVKEEDKKEDYTHSTTERVINDLPYIDSSTIPEDKKESEEKEN